MGFTEVLTIVLVILKATHHIDIAWWQCFLPEIIAAVIYVIMLILLGAGALAAFFKTR